MEKRRLGRGLDSLISFVPAAPAEAGPAQEIELSRIELNPKQPRLSIEPEALQGLADLIRSVGVLQPIVLRPRGEMYELVMGERRLRAAHMAGLTRVPAIVREVPDEQMLEMALIENVQREDLNPIEKALGIRRMMTELGLTQELVAGKLGMERSTVANLVRLLDLPEEIRENVSRETISAGHARAILQMQSAEAMIALAERIVKEGLSVREAERLASLGAATIAGLRTRAEPSPQVKHLAAVLQESLGSRVEISARGTRGRIIIHFGDNEEFQRLFELMTGTAPAAQTTAA